MSLFGGKGGEVGNKFEKVDGGLKSQNKCWGREKIEYLQCTLWCARRITFKFRFCSLGCGEPFNVFRQESDLRSARVI